MLNQIETASDHSVKAPRLSNDILNAIGSSKHFPTYEGLETRFGEMMTRKRAGHLVCDVFNDTSMAAWGEFTAQADSYEAAHEIAALQSNQSYFGEVASELEPRGPLTLIEEGTGALPAIQAKTIFLTKAFNAVAYIGMDHVASSAYMAALEVRDALPHVNADTRFIDFNKDDFLLRDDSKLGKIRYRIKLRKDAPAVFLQLGGTLGNIDGFSDKLPFNQVSSALGNTRRHMNAGDYFFLGINQSRKRDEAYDHALFHAFHQRFPEFLKENLPHCGIKPNDFKFFTRWVPNTHVQVFGYVMQNDGALTVRDNKITYKKGDEFITCNSWRFQQDFMDDVYARNGLKLQRILSDGQFPWTVQALKAV